MDNTVIILFNGFRTPKTCWEYKYDPVLKTLVKIDFLAKLKKICKKVYMFNQPFFNIEYYYKNEDRYKQKKQENIQNEFKLWQRNINFKMEDIDLKRICTNVYEKVKLKYGNNKRYVIIGHSFGGTLALLFSKMFKKEVIYTFCIDNTPQVLSFFKEELKKREPNALLSNLELKQKINTIRKANGKQSNMEIDKLYKIIHYKFIQDSINYFDSKLYTPTILFKAHYPKHIEAYKTEKNKLAKLEQTLLKKNKNLKGYIRMNDADHLIILNQVFSNEIIATIKQNLMIGEQ